MPSTKHGTFHWNELLTDDVDAAKKFYGDVVGWTFEGMNMGEMTYWVAKDGDDPVGGIMAMPTSMPFGTPPHWMTYLAVDDVDARVAKAKDAGALIVNEPFDVPGVGRIAIIKDGGNAVIGWITPAAAS